MCVCVIFVPFRYFSVCRDSSADECEVYRHCFVLIIWLNVLFQCFPCLCKHILKSSNIKQPLIPLAVPLISDEQICPSLLFPVNKHLHPVDTPSRSNPLLSLIGLGVRDGTMQGRVDRHCNKTDNNSKFQVELLLHLIKLSFVFIPAHCGPYYEVQVCSHFATEEAAFPSRAGAEPQTRELRNAPDRSVGGKVFIEIAKCR